MPMPLIAVVSGLLLIGVGAVGYALSEAAHRWTALIPAVAGLLLLLPGAVAQAKPSLRKHMMHVAAAVGLIGLVLAGGRLAMVLVRGGGSALGLASLAAMALICGIFLALCIKSFRDARRNRSAEPRL